VKKVFFISLALVLALSIGLVGCDGVGPVGPEPSSKIVIAASVSLTGPLADVHNLAKGPVVEAWLAANPTMTVGDSTYSVEEAYLDDGSVLNNMLENTDTIIEGINAGTYHFLLGPTCTAYLEAQAPKATTGKVVQMTMEGGATSLFDNLGAYKYSFINLSFSNWFEIPVFAKLIAEADSEAHAYIGYQNDDHGLEYKGQTEKYFAKEGIEIDGTFAMTSGDTSANSNLISAAKAANSTVLCVFAYPEFVFATHAVAKAQGYNPKAMIIGPGGNFGVYGAPFMAGADAEGVMCFAVANNKTTKGTVGTLMSTLEATLGMFSVDYWGHPLYWTALDILKEAAEAVGSDNDGAGFTIDQDAFRSYIANNKFDTALGETWYVTPSVVLGPTDYSWTDEQLQWPVPANKAGLLNYKCHTGEIGQWQDGYIEIVGYDGIGTETDEYELANYDVTASFVYPKAEWTP
jgi:ABC-type branched-subunit amino acid transport system substrate-binding protein